MGLKAPHCCRFGCSLTFWQNDSFPSPISFKTWHNKNVCRSKKESVVLINDGPQFSHRHYVCVTVCVLWKETTHGETVHSKCSGFCSVMESKTPLVSPTSDLQCNNGLLMTQGWNKDAGNQRDSRGEIHGSLKDAGSWGDMSLCIELFGLNQG